MRIELLSECSSGRGIRLSNKQAKDKRWLSAKYISQPASYFILLNQSAQFILTDKPLISEWILKKVTCRSRGANFTG
jgi:hypothetical protein